MRNCWTPHQYLGHFGVRVGEFSPAQVDAPAAVLLERALVKPSLPWAPLLVLLLREYGRRLPAATHAAWLQVRPVHFSSTLGLLEKPRCPCAGHTSRRHARRLAAGAPHTSSTWGFITVPWLLCWTLSGCFTSDGLLTGTSVCLRLLMTAELLVFSH